MLTRQYSRKQNTGIITEQQVEPLFPANVIIEDNFTIERIPVLDIGVKTSEDTIELLHREAHSLEKTLIFIDNCKALEKKLLKKLKVITRALQSLKESDQIIEDDVDMLAVSQQNIEIEYPPTYKGIEGKSIEHVNDFDN